MGSLKDLEKTRLEARTDTVVLPTFGRVDDDAEEGEFLEDEALGYKGRYLYGPPVFIIRGLDPHELAFLEDENAAVVSNSIIETLEKIQNGKAASEALVDALNYDGKTHANVMRQVRYLKAAIIEPAHVNQIQLRKMNQAYPVEFTLLFNRLNSLIAQGYQAVKKPQSSGDDQTSKSA